MNIRNIALPAAAVVLLGMAGTFVAVRAQGPLYDTVIVDLPYTVSVRDTVLPPGHYVIRQLSSPTDSRVLQIFSNDGMKLETTVIIRADKATPFNKIYRVIKSCRDVGYRMFAFRAMSSKAKGV